ncbi:MAG: CHAD domain-containing protein [Bacteroidota bacterium]|nr:CHAD domain-containing protein [Bacteroidota bacterium]
MKTLTKYVKKREKSTHSILGQPKQTFTPATFHKLRVEIKKLNAFFSLLNFCATDFKRKKSFKPFKRLFRQAGKVREIHVEEDMLKKNFNNTVLNEYKSSLKELRLQEQEIFFSMVNKKYALKLKKAFNKLHPFLMSADKKNVTNYMEKKRMQILKFFNNKLQPDQLHDLRIRLKEYYYNRESLDLSVTDETIQKKDILPDLLGEWHDCHVIIKHHQKAMDTGEINGKELNQLKKIKAKFTSDSKVLLNKISLALPKSALSLAKNG